jgi:HSP20 family molecular chaperone IbpA
MAMRELVPWSNRGREMSTHRGEQDHPFLTLHREMTLFDDAFRGFDLNPLGSDRFLNRAMGGWPSIEVSETDKEVKVTADLPGLEDKDVEVELRTASWLSVARSRPTRKIRTGCSASAITAGLSGVSPSRMSSKTRSALRSRTAC